MKNFALYGAGYCGLMFCEFFIRKGVRPACILDRDPEKTGIIVLGGGIRVEEPGKTSAIKKETLIIVCLFSKGGVYQQIKESLLEEGYTNIIHVLDLRENRELFENQRVVMSLDKANLKKYKKELQWVYNGFNDLISRKTLLSILDFAANHTEGDSIPKFPVSQQYFALDCYKRMQGETEVFVDCGAFKGDVLNCFLNIWHNDFCAYYAFEPDPANAERIHYDDIYRDKIHVMEEGLSDRDEVVFMRNYLNSNSVVTEDGEFPVSCVPLDQYKERIKPTFIKIDVEGYEKKVLYGAEEIIRRDKPLLAVAIYHKPEDLWEIPSILHKWLPCHKFYLRSYMNYLETVLYVVPPDREVGR